MVTTVTPQQYSAIQREYLSQFDHSFDSEYVDIEPLGGVEAHVLVAGEGDPIILFHGGGAVGANWANLVDRLAEDYRVYTPDAPGRGLSDRVSYRKYDYREVAEGFVTGLLNGLALNGAILGGNSQGGFFTLTGTLANPDRVEKLLIVGAPQGLDWEVSGSAKVRGTPLLNEVVSSMTPAPTPESVQESLAGRIILDAEAAPTDYFDLRHAARCLPGVEDHMRRGLEEIVTPHGLRRSYYIRDEIPKIDAPTLFVWGEYDVYAPPASGEEACEIMPDAQLVTVPDAAHSPWLDQPQACAAAIREFLRAGETSDIELGND
jgi:2-succinyl-6-hydroxy-2,4-cyclohexadiene-1-carboxylate synthase